mgnify:FL=1
MGLKGPNEITFTMINFREAHFSGALLARLEPGQLLKDDCPEDYAKPWRAANPESFR